MVDVENMTIEELKKQLCELSVVRQNAYNNIDEANTQTDIIKNEIIKRTEN